MRADWEHGGFGLYVHWPFCEAKCPYCDFNSHVSRSIDHAAWRGRYLQELRRWRGLTGPRRLDSIFFGGGTPSLMEVETAAAVIDAAVALWSPSDTIEITLEANPSSIERDRLAGFRAAGINRVSVGVQALNDADLKRLGRLHSAADALAAVDIAQTLFDRASFDLIYARQNQGLKDWESELKQALSMGLSHLSLYQLTIEPGTAFGDLYKRGKLRGLPGEDSAADLFQLTRELCAAEGVPAYETSNHAVPGEESRHNLIYWRYGDYVGIGPGAHGRVTIGGRRHQTFAESNPKLWLDLAEAGQSDRVMEPIDGDAQALEYALMSLRLREGMDRTRFERLGERRIDDGRLRGLEKLGFVTGQSSRIVVTESGAGLLNSILAELLPD